MHTILRNQLDIGFIDKSRGLQNVPGSFVAHITLGDAPQFGFDKRN
jgi:hypothetical protein